MAQTSTGTTTDSNYFFDDLETVVYGCHANSREEVRQVFEEAGLYTFSFAEYFLDQPITKQDQDTNERKIYFPFLPWAASQLLFQITTNNNNGKIETIFSSKTRDWKQNLRETCRLGTNLSKWESQIKRIRKFYTAKEKNQPNNPWPPEKIRDIKTIIDHRDEAEQLSGQNSSMNEALVSYNIQLHPWITTEKLDKSPIIVLRYPIATEYCYYGHFVIVYQELKGLGKQLKQLEKNLNIILKDLADNRYAPTLSLLHIANWEKSLKKAIADNYNNFSELRTFFTKIPPISLNLDKSPDEIEQAFGRLWRWRKDKFEETTNKDKSSTIRSIENSIILDKYHIASPAMIKQIREVVRSAALMDEVGNGAKPLPSALIFGEAGSGKDKMARLIGTLTKDFWWIQPHTQNMAAVKPTIFAIPLMFGFKLGNLKAPGFFCSPEDINTDDTSELNPNDKNSPKVLILDELNSLDYDMQGSLLRVLENNEATPMFCAPPSLQSPQSPQSRGVNALVIGVVNEDPDRVTREEELNLLDNAREFLGKAETARLYEALHKARRLRPDLVYRLKRGAYVRMPALRERREDIPLLFLHACRQFIKGLAHRTMKTISIIQCELEAYDELMRRDFAWPGNIRQLQAVAKRVAGVTWDRYNNNGQNTLKIFVTRADVGKVLAVTFPEAYPKKSVHPH